MKANVFIKTEVLNKAIEDSGMPFDFFDKKCPFVKKIQNGDPITLSQAKKLSTYTMMPLGLLFLSAPLQNNKVAAEFRTINNKKNNELSKNLKDLLLDMDFKKNWMSEYKKGIGEPKNNFVKSTNLSLPPQDLANYIRSVLKLEKNWFVNIPKGESFSYLKSKIEPLGFIIMSSGIVKNNNRRKLKLTEFRGFALTDNYSPLIFINACDNNNSRAFTLLHEFVHLITSTDDDILIDLDKSVESKINSVVAELIMPKVDIFYKTGGTEISNFPLFNLLLSYFKVNPTSLAYRLKTYNLISEHVFNSVINNSKLNIAEKEIRGGNYYTTMHSRVSKNFVESVNSALTSNRIGYITAYRLLGVSPKGYTKFLGMYNL